MIPEASVIIPTYDDWPVLQKCLDCLAQQSVSPDRFEVIVANNNASAEVPAFLQLPPNARVIHVAKPGSYAARNAAMRVVQADVLFFTDSDCQPDRTWIENGLAALAKVRPIDRIAGEVELFPNGKTWTGPELYDRVHSLQQATYAEKGWCATANLVTRRAAFDLVGPFSEDAFSGGDREWGSRAHALGSAITLSHATLIRHPARENFAVLANKARRLTGNRHHWEITAKQKGRSTASYLLPRGRDLQRIALDPRLTEQDKLRLMWVHYRLSLVIFIELFRLRYLSGTPTRS
jgi:glycosyltransferase involved in cell wall biosynthesis